MSYSWYWWNGNEWTAYSEKDSNSIEKAFIARSPELILRKYRLVFSKVAGRNLYYQENRVGPPNKVKIRRVSKKDEDDFISAVVQSNDAPSSSSSSSNSHTLTPNSSVPSSSSNANTPKRLNSKATLSKLKASSADESTAMDVDFVSNHNNKSPISLSSDSVVNGTLLRSKSKSLKNSAAPALPRRTNSASKRKSQSSAALDTVNPHLDITPIKRLIQPDPVSPPDPSVVPFRLSTIADDEGTSSFSSRSKKSITRPPPVVLPDPDVLPSGYQVKISPLEALTSSNVTDNGSDAMDIDPIVSKASPKGSKKKSKKELKVVEVIDTELPPAPIPNKDPAPAQPYWEFVNPKNNTWEYLPPALNKMVETMSSKMSQFVTSSPVFGGGVSVTPHTMLAKLITSGDSIQLRRTPGKVFAAPSPTSALAASVSPPLKAKSSKTTSKKPLSSSQDVDFAVDASTLDNCKKATSWKSIESSTDSVKGQLCVICCCELGNDARKIVQLSKCGLHYFHENCIAGCFQNGFLTCPICQTIYGIRTGTMPKGRMDVSRKKNSLPGYEGYGLIVIHYSFDDGVQGSQHPHPGRAYYGTSRTAYLPDSPEGNTVLQLLQIAWERRLTFTIGTSVTTGHSDCVIWNGIHHKTNINGGPTQFGYPDPTYLQRVTDELNAKGVHL